MQSKRPVIWWDETDSAHGNLPPFAGCRQATPYTARGHTLLTCGNNEGQNLLHCGHFEGRNLLHCGNTEGYNLLKIGSH